MNEEKKQWSRTIAGYQIAGGIKGGKWGPLPPYPEEGEKKGTIYSWRFGLGPIEVRKWGKGVDWRMTRDKGGG